MLHSIHIAAHTPTPPSAGRQSHSFCIKRSVCRLHHHTNLHTLPAAEYVHRPAPVSTALLLLPSPPLHHAPRKSKRRKDFRHCEVPRTPYHSISSHPHNLRACQTYGKGTARPP